MKYAGLVVVVFFYTKNWRKFFQVICFDGGQRRKICGLFNKLDNVPKEEWDTIEANIRAANKKSKEQAVKDAAGATS